MAQRTVSKRSPGWRQCRSLRKNRSAFRATTQTLRKVRSSNARFPEVMGTGEQALREAFFFSTTKLSSLALVTPTQLPQDGREQNEEVIQKEPEMLPRGKRPEECSGPL